VKASGEGSRSGGVTSRKQTLAHSPRSIRGLSGSSALLAILFLSTIASAEEPVCEDPRVRIEGRPDERWLEAIARACAGLEAMPDSDPTSRVRLVPAGRDLIVEVALEDGRSALRRVRDPASLMTTLDALLTLPPSPRLAEPAAPPAAPPPPANEHLDVERPQLPAAASPRIGFEVGAAVGGRIAGAQNYLSVAPGGFAAIRVDDWFLGIHARWDIIQRKSDVHVRDFEMDTVGAGVSIARRFRSDVAVIDVGIAPRLLVETQSFLTESGIEDADAQTDLRVGAFTRVSLGHAQLRPFVGLDAELSPARLRRDIRVGPELPVLPSWSAGFDVGVAWGQP
jgi:hypothetical protein